MFRRPLRSAALAALTLAALAVLVVPAVAARFTSRFDPLETELQQRSAELSRLTDKASKSRKKLFDGALKKLGKTTTSLKAEIKLGRQAAAPLVKKLDAADAVVTDFSSAADGLRSDVQDRLDAVQAAVDAAIAKKVTAAQVQKQIDAARSKLESSDVQTNVVKRFVRIGQAEAKVTQAEKLAPKIAGGGGGAGKPLRAGEVAQVDEDGAGNTIVFDKFKFEQITPLPDGANTEAIVITLYRTGAGARELAITIHDPSVRTIDVGVFASTLGGDASAFFRKDNSAFGIAAGGGTLDIKQYDSAAGTITMDFTIDATPSASLTNGTLTLTDFRR